MASFLHSYEHRRKNIAVFDRYHPRVSPSYVPRAILIIPKYACNRILWSVCPSNISTFLDKLLIHPYRISKIFSFRLSGKFGASEPTTVHVRARADDIGDYIRRVTEKERNSRSIMKPEPRCMQLAERSSPDAVDRQIAETPSRCASGRKAAMKGERERNGRTIERETEGQKGNEGGEGGPLDNAVNRESGLSHRARQNTSATTVRSLRNPLTALGVDSPRRRLVGW